MAFMLDDPQTPEEAEQMIRENPHLSEVQKSMLRQAAQNSGGSGGSGGGGGTGPGGSDRLDGGRLHSL
jgi:hypothetical protein